MINKCAVDKMCGIPAVTSRILLLKIARLALDVYLS
jgi:hypothetical protein